MKTIHIRQVLKEDNHYTTIQKLFTKATSVAHIYILSVLLSQRIKPITLVLLAPFCLNPVQESRFTQQGHIKK